MASSINLLKVDHSNNILHSQFHARLKLNKPPNIKHHHHHHYYHHHLLRSSHHLLPFFGVVEKLPKQHPIWEPLPALNDRNFASVRGWEPIDPVLQLNMLPPTWTTQAADPRSAVLAVVGRPESRSANLCVIRVFTVTLPDRVSNIATRIVLWWATLKDD